MKPTIPYIAKKFNEYNTQMFEGRLPMPPIELGNAKTYIGLCVFRTQRNVMGKPKKYDFRLRFNTRYDLPEQEIEDTIIHEMIHYYIGINDLEDTSSHGKLFRSIMNHINQHFGRNLTISHKSTPEQNHEGIDPRARWHVIATLEMVDGRFGIKVLPRVAPRIVNYYNAFCHSKNVKKIDLYMSNDPFFNRYPNSSALKAQYADRSEVQQHLQGAERLRCDGTNIMRNQ